MAVTQQPNPHFNHPGRAHAKFVWLSPSKVRRVTRVIGARAVSDVLDMLPHFGHRSALILAKVIKSAASNYLQKTPSASMGNLYIRNLYVNDGPRVKRMWRRARGRADVLLKRMCHITAIVDEKKNINHPISTMRSIAHKPRSRIQSNNQDIAALIDNSESIQSALPPVDKTESAEPEQQLQQTSSEEVSGTDS